MIKSVRVKPKREKPGVLVSDDHLIAHVLVFVPANGTLIFPILVQRVNDESIIVQINSSVFHQDTYTSNIAAVVINPTFAEL